MDIMGVTSVFKRVSTKRTGEHYESIVVCWIGHPVPIGLYASGMTCSDKNVVTSLAKWTAADKIFAQNGKRALQSTPDLHTSCSVRVQQEATIHVRC